MIRKLKIKLIVIVAVILVLVFAAVLLTLNLFMHSADNRRTNEMLQTMVQLDGFPFDDTQPDALQGGNIDAGGGPGGSEPLGNAMRFERFFYAKVDVNGRIIEMDIDRMMFGFTPQQAQVYVDEVLTQNKTEGTVENFQYLVGEKTYGKIIAFAEKSTETQLLTRLMQTSLWVIGASSVVLLLLAVLLANWVTKPVQQSFERQRRFISDASHELKTPVTIIAANTELAQEELGPNKWLDGIQHQTSRMNGLINDLLALARSDEQAQDSIVRTRFNLSDAVSAALLEFESRAYEEQKTLASDIEPDIYYVGDAGRLRQLVSILVDNALAHSNAGSNVEVSLKNSGGKVQLRVKNTGSAIDDREKQLIFERFYRSDQSRSRSSGGYGLGLSIAKAIVDEHKGSIAAETQNGNTVFSVVL